MSVDSYLDPRPALPTSRAYADAELLRRVVADISAARLHVESYAASEGRQTGQSRHLRALALPDFVQKLAHYHTEINGIHPFRRATAVPSARSFVRLAAEPDTGLTGRLLTTTSTPTRTSGRPWPPTVFRAITSPAADRKAHEGTGGLASLLGEVGTGGAADPCQVQRGPRRPVQLAKWRWHGDGVVTQRTRIAGLADASLNPTMRQPLEGEGTRCLLGRSTSSNDGQAESRPHW